MSSRAQLIDGKKYSRQLLAGFTRAIASHGIKAKLAVIRVGDNPASGVYVRNKQKMSFDLGLDFLLYHFDALVTEPDIVKVLMQLNDDPTVNGILIQLPLPAHLDPKRLTSLVHPLKDVDGLGVISAGRLVQHKPYFKPCTPLGVVYLLKQSCKSLSGKNVVIVGRSLLVGRPLYDLLLHEDCTVTTCHSKTRHLAAITSQADIVVSATGQIKLIKARHVKPGAIVIDVGLSVHPATGKLAGDVDFASVAPRASRITPVPGGVGPMTMAMLFHNVLKAYCLQNNLDYTNIASF